ncbi:hypothetical protein M3Y98_00222700 [Aphelenchoides besseyi]|nr:hypothetical protein M3Y98_00222700 [Aphelenchoides besseyi]KAI6200495.1 hypothetical protein M3Y96_00740300 [Aphelenchoides besseyi]
MRQLQLISFCICFVLIVLSQMTEGFDFNRKLSRNSLIFSRVHPRLEKRMVHNLSLLRLSKLFRADHEKRMNQDKRMMPDVAVESKDNSILWLLNRAREEATNDY